MVAMRLADTFRTMLEDSWSDVFPRQATTRRAVDLAMALPVTMGRRTISRTISTLGLDQQDWSASYKMFSRSPWASSDLFGEVIETHVEEFAGRIVVAMDDTNLHKTGKSIAAAGWLRDPLSPPFQTNLIYGIRFLQAALIFPLHRNGNHSARSLPIRFAEVAPVKKPGSKATPAQVKAYKKARRKKNLSTSARSLMVELRARFDAARAVERNMLMVLDGSFCNRTLFHDPIERVDLLARARKDARLCLPSQEAGQRVYDPSIFTPEQILNDEALPFRPATLHYGSDWREVRFKEINHVLWRRGGGPRPLRLIVLAPQPYKVRNSGSLQYRQPAYLLTTDTTSPAEELIQAYLDRWQIEVNHREEKSLFGVGQAQVWSPLAVSRQPEFVVAVYSLLHLSALKLFGPSRSDVYPLLPKWRRNGKRPSLLDIITLLRHELNETSGALLVSGTLPQNALLTAYT